MDANENDDVMDDFRLYSLLRHNTFGIEAYCARFLDFFSAEEVVAAVLRGDVTRPYFVLGAGSNLLLTGDYEGTVLHSSIRGIEAITPSCNDDSSGILLACGSGETWDDVVRYCVENALYGAENLSGIPGDVGATAVQNVGAYGAEVSQLVYEVETIDLQTAERRVYDNAECRYAYRHSVFKSIPGRYFVTRVTYRLSRTFAPNTSYGNIRAVLGEKGISHPTAQQLRSTVIEIRNAKIPDPKKEGNAGSFFVNPIVTRDIFAHIAERYPSVPSYPLPDGRVKVPAAWLIEQSGWKGKTLGRATVSAKQPLVLVNSGGATGGDILALCDAVQADVARLFGIELQPEVNII